MKKLLLMSLFLLVVVQLGAEPVPIGKYLPQDAKLDGSQDLLQYLQKAVDENQDVILTGSKDAAKPLVYGIKIKADKIGLVIPAGRTLRGETGAELKRLPSAGKVIVTGKSVRLTGIIINGNKAAHWPEFQDLGKSDMGITTGSNNLIEDCYVYDIPGIAFGTYTDNSVFRRCKAKNAGYIDIKFKADYYQGKWDQWSGDSFYIRGNNNIVMDCDSEDAFRWDYTTCHENSGNAMYINCTGRDLRWRSYGFIDIEGCDGLGSTMINCKSPDGVISVSTNGSKLINCEAARINVHNTDQVFLLNNRTLGGGMAVGGWSTPRNTQVRGGAMPMVIGNEINRSSAGFGIPETADWSFSIFSTDGAGLVADNVLNEFKGQAGTGPGLKFDNVPNYNNEVKYGTYQAPARVLDDGAKAEIDQHVRARMMEFAQSIPKILTRLKIKSGVVASTFAPIQSKFILDTNDKGIAEKWETKRPADLKDILIGKHWDSQIGQYSGVAWYFIDLPLDEDLQHNCDEVYLLFGGIEGDATIFINGNKVGENKKKGEFVLKVPKKDLFFMNERKLNNLTVRVYRPAGMGGIYGPVAAILTK